MRANLSFSPAIDCGTEFVRDLRRQIGSCEGELGVRRPNSEPIRHAGEPRQPTNWGGRVDSILEPPQRLFGVGLETGCENDLTQPYGRCRLDVDLWCGAEQLTPA